MNNTVELERLDKEVSSDSLIVNKLLDDKTYHIEFNGHLTNHSKHAVIALAGIGLAPEKIEQYYRNHAAKTTYGFALEPPMPSKYEITDDNWKKYLGKRTSFSSYCKFFDEQEKKLGTEKLLKKYLPTLLLGWVGAFTHATIHLGWALSIKHRYMIVEGLAYMSFTYVSCNVDRLSKISLVNDKSPVDSLFRIANVWDEKREEMKLQVKDMLENESSDVARNIHPELRRSGLQYRIARMLGEGHPLIYDLPEWLDKTDMSKIWEELYYAVSILYLSVPGDFVLLHLITSLYAMEKIADSLPDGQKKKVVECYWVGMLCVVFSGGDFPKRRKLKSLNSIYFASRDSFDSSHVDHDWKQIIARAVEEEEEHNPKLVFVLKRMWESSRGKSIYRAAANQFTKTPDLPETFEEPPVKEQDIEGYYEHRTVTQSKGNVYLLPQSDLLRSFHTIVRDKNSSREDFIFYSGKIINALIEAGTNLLPFVDHTANTPVGETYHGLKMVDNVCGVSVLRAGESMEIGLRDTIKSLKIGKILIQRDKVTKLPHLYYTSLPKNIHQNYVLLVDPMLATGGTALAAIDVLIEKGVAEKNIIFINFLAVQQGVNAVHNKYPNVKIVTSAIDKNLNENAYMIPGIGDFGDRYFGTDK